MKIKLVCLMLMGLLSAGCGGGGGGGGEQPAPTQEEQTPPVEDSPTTDTPSEPQNPPNRPSSPRPQPQQPEPEEEEEVPATPGTPGPTPNPSDPDTGDSDSPEQEPTAPAPTEPEEPAPSEPEEPSTDPEDPVLNPNPYASAGCGFDPMEEGEHTLPINGTDRVFTLDLPTDYDQNRAYAMVFGFHGRGRDGQFQNTNYGNLASTMGDDAVLVYPEGLYMDNQGAVGDKHGGSGTTWEIEGSADLEFFDAMLRQLKSETCIDEQRVYTVGFSMGGYFSARLACERGMDVRAFAAAGAGAPIVDPAMCENMSAAWLAHDPEDSAIDYEEAGLALRDYWLDVNMCGPETRPITSEGDCVEYTNCAVDYPVQWCTYSQGSNHHQWPDFAPREVWDFFLSLE